MNDLKEVLLKLGYTELNPMQAQAISEGFLEEDRVLVSAPTASGKTLLALLAVIKNFQETRKKAIYMVPLRALARDKLNDFLVLKNFGITVALSIGDLDSADSLLSEKDLIIATCEKTDSLLRHKAEWLNQVNLVIVDELHLLEDDERGGTLEIVLTKFFREGKKIIGLSATIGNAEEIAEWLKAKYIKSDYRPVELIFGICTKKELSLANTSIPLNPNSFLEELVEKAIMQKEGAGQVLVFSSTRKGAESAAELFSSVVARNMTEQEREKAKILSQRVLRVFSPPTRQCRLLSKLIEKGVAFHHAGISGKQLSIIEEGFKKERVIKAIGCTTTLAMGMDLPASWVILKDLKRFNVFSSNYISKLEAMQCLGRAGRPRYDKIGYGILVCNEKEKQFVVNKYILGELEEIYSKLGMEPVLRMHVLELISSNYCKNFMDLLDFFNSTFYSHQYGSSEEFSEKIRKIVNQLKEMDFLREKGNSLFATPIGRRVSELYIDPLSGNALISFIKSKSNKHEFNYLLAICRTTELMPYPSVKSSEEKTLWEELYYFLDDFEISDWEMDDNSLGAFKTAKLLNSWINEESEEAILEKFDVPPGILFSKRKIAEWLFYSLSELSYLLNNIEVQKNAKKLQKRIKHGVKEELIDLCRIKGIGRVRARRLYAKGIKSVEELKKHSIEEIKSIARGVI